MLGAGLAVVMVPRPVPSSPFTSSATAPGVNFSSSSACSQARSSAHSHPLESYPPGQGCCSAPVLDTPWKVLGRRLNKAVYKDPERAKDRLVQSLVLWASQPKHAEEMGSFFF